MRAQPRRARECREHSPHVGLGRAPTTRSTQPRTICFAVDFARPTARAAPPRTSQSRVRPPAAPDACNSAGDCRYARERASRSKRLRRSLGTTSGRGLSSMNIRVPQRVLSGLAPTASRVRRSASGNTSHPSDTSQARGVSEPEENRQPLRRTASAGQAVFALAIGQDRGLTARQNVLRKRSRRSRRRGGPLVEGPARSGDLRDVLNRALHDGGR
jgi:hypothetical protein